MSGAGDVPSVWLTAAAVRRDGISIQPPSEGELHGNSAARRSWGGMGPAGCRPARRIGGRLQKTNTSFTEHQQSQMWRSRKEEPKDA